VRTSFLPGLALWSLFPRPQSHGPTFWTVFYGKRLVNGVPVNMDSSFPSTPLYVQVKLFTPAATSYKRT
jgi:hypothetical protein